MPVKELLILLFHLTITSGTDDFFKVSQLELEKLIPDLQIIEGVLSVHERPVKGSEFSW